MARPSKLTPMQWETVYSRLMKGEKAADLAREYGMTKGRISQQFAQRCATVRETAEKLAQVELEVGRMTLTDQIMTRTLADELRAVSNHLVSAAKYGAQVAHRLSGIAASQADLVDDGDPSKSTKELQNIAVLQKIANSSAEVGLKLLGANRELPEDEPPPAKTPQLSHLSAKELEAMKRKIYGNVS